MMELSPSLNSCLAPPSIIITHSHSLPSQSYSMSYLKVNDFFTKLMQLYRDKNHKAIISEITHLFSHGLEASQQDWLQQFNFGGFLKIDNMAGPFFNILEALQMWQVERLDGVSGLSNSFGSYLLVLEMCLIYLDMMAKDNQWFSTCVKYLVLKSKSVLREAKDSGADSLTTTRSLQRLVQQLRDFKSSKNIDPETKKNFQLMINNLLVSCYLTIRDYTKSKKIIDDKEIQRDLRQFSKQEINNFRFQAARLQIYEGKIGEAIASLESIVFTTNSQRRLILKYLVPCNMYAWRFFKGEDFPEYDSLGKSIVSGNFCEFFNVVDRFQMVWIKRGIYQLIMGLLSMVWRNFMKRLHKYSQTETLSLKEITKLTGIMNGNFNEQDCLFHLTNLINCGYMKGYIYLTNDNLKTLVLRNRKGGIFPKNKISQEV